VYAKLNNNMCMISLKIEVIGIRTSTFNSKDNFMQKQNITFFMKINKAVCLIFYDNLSNT